MGEQSRTCQTSVAEAVTPSMKGLLLNCLPEEVSVARRAIRRCLYRYRREVIELAEQCASETVANAIVHSDSKKNGNDGVIALVIVELREKIRIEVIDDGAVNNKLAIDTHEDMEKESGRGLFIVDALADRWGTRVDEHGRNVWFEVCI